MKIGLASDHRGYKLKTKIGNYLKKRGFDVTDFGTTSTSSVDYPNFGILLGESASNNEIDLGIAICGTGIGISLACNKVKGVRCAKVSNTNEAKLSILHNNANVIALSGRMPTFRAYDIIDVILKTKYTNDERHQRRIDLITEYEEKNKK